MRGPSGEGARLEPPSPRPADAAGAEPAYASSLGEDRMNIGETDLHNRLAFILAGRAAEKLVFGEYTAGAENDLAQATRIARKMVAHWGMSEAGLPAGLLREEK